jgi:hypothetical protein
VPELEGAVETPHDGGYVVVGRALVREMTQCGDGLTHGQLVVGVLGEVGGCLHVLGGAPTGGDWEQSMYVARRLCSTRWRTVLKHEPTPVYKMLMMYIVTLNSSYILISKLSSYLH